MSAPAVATPAHPPRGLDRALDTALDKALADLRIVGAVLLVSQDGHLVYARAAGLADRAAQHPMTLETPFRYASVTKPFTVMAALKLIEAGVLAADHRVDRWLPWFSPKTADGASAPLTIAHLLSHTAGLDYRFGQAPDGAYAQAGISDGLDEAAISLAENLARIASVPLDRTPGTAWRYSVATDVLGAVIEAATAKPLSRAMAELVTTPLRLSAAFHADPDLLATPYYNGERGPILMSGVTDVPLPAYIGSAVRFDPWRIGRQTAFASGGAGMAGTARDVLKLLETFRSGDFLSATLRQEARRDRVGIEAMTQGPGWGFSWIGAVLLDPVAASSSLSPGTVSWGGVYGHWWCIDDASGRVAVLLTNTAYEGMIGTLPQDIAQALGPQALDR